MGLFNDTILSLLQIILVILIIILVIKYFFDSDIYQKLLKVITTARPENTNMENTLQTARTEAFQNINRVVEESFANSSTSNNQSNLDGNITSYLNKQNRIKLELYYKPSCPHCKTFMSVWSKIINDLPSDATYEEINCELIENKDKINENKITSVPSLVLLVDNQKKFYMGSRTYNDIARFLSLHGVNLVKRSFEEFNNTTTNNTNGATGVGDSIAGVNPHCPAVSFDKQIDIATDDYMYQIFNANGQYGYATGGYNTDKLLTPFQAAYSTVDSYLSSLPDDTDPSKSSYKHIDECAGLYANNIINFGLCDIDQLNTIKEYQTNIASGNSSTYIDGTDYSNNSKVVNAIINACGFNS